MKKRRIFISLVILFIFSITYVSAIEISLSKQSYLPRETFQAEITGNFVSLKSSNIFIYKYGIPRSMPVISDLTKQGDIYYFYAILPNQEGNFSLRIENAQYIQGGEIKKEPIIINFTLSQTNSTALSIEPGFIITDKDFSINVKSLNGNSEVSATLESNGEKKNLSIIEEVQKTFEFSIVGSELGKTNLKINDYNLPVFITKKQNTSIIPKEKEISFFPSELIAKVATGQNYFFEVLFENSGKTNLSNLKISTTLNANLTPTIIDSLEVNQRVYLNITIPIDDKQKENISNKIIINCDNDIFTLPIFLEITKNKSQINLNQTIPISKNCKEIGEICLVNEICTSEITGSLEGPCCLGSCIEKKESDYTWIFGVIIIIIVFAGIFLLYKRAKKKQKIKSSQEILKEKTDKYKKRMQPKELPPQEEVRKRLGNI